jgi:hypothetical protein
VGSSSSRSLGAPTRLAPRSRRRRMPPEYVFTRRSAASVRSICSRIRSALVAACFFCWPYRRATITRFSRPVIISSTAAAWPANPIMRRTAIGSLTTSWPPTVSVPSSGRIRVATMRTNVVLPAPLGPRMAVGFPGGSSRVRSERACTFPNVLPRPWASIRACMTARASFLWCVVSSRAVRAAGWSARSGEGTADPRLRASPGLRCCPAAAKRPSLALLHSVRAYALCATSGVGPSWIGLVGMGSGPRGATRGLGSFRGLARIIPGRGRSRSAPPPR